MAEETGVEISEAELDRRIDEQKKNQFLKKSWRDSLGKTFG